VLDNVIRCLSDQRKCAVGMISVTVRVYAVISFVTRILLYPYIEYDSRLLLADVVIWTLQALMLQHLQVFPQTHAIVFALDISQPGRLS